MKLKNSNFDETQKPELRWYSRTWIVMKLKNLNNKKNSKAEIVTKLKNLNCDYSKTQIGTKLKNSNCDKTQNHEMWKTQNMKKLKNSNVTIIKLWQNSNCDKTKNTNCDKTNKLKLWQKEQINWGKFWQILIYETNLKEYFIRTTWHLDNRWDVLWAAFCNLAMFCCLSVIIQVF